MNRPANKGKASKDGPRYEVMMYYFTIQAGRFKFRYDHADFAWIDMDTIITSVTLSFNASTKIYTLNREDADTLNSFVAERR